ncbi:hypothetical protein ALP32_103644 [Pseudomonas avellanae]|uniref:Uncharacterized protein n=1 Tax=Pseudomonas avellanae TaxID=46257 RepID=A0A3M5TBX0_9PSED|nr:hypothetical protein ALP32_103644 [Pseudomonas avellanae]
MRTPGGVEQLAVDAARQQLDPFKATPLQLDLLADARHQRDARTVVKPAQVVGQQAGDEPHAVLLRVLRKIGMKAADHRNPQAPRCPQCRQPQRAFSGDVQHVRPAPLPASQQLVHRRLTPLQPRVTRYRPAPAQHQVIGNPGVDLVALARPNQLDPMPAQPQPVTKSPQGIGNAVDLGSKGFSDQGDIKNLAHESSFGW